MGLVKCTRGSGLGQLFKSARLVINSKHNKTLFKENSLRIERQVKVVYYPAVVASG